MSDGIEHVYFFHHTHTDIGYTHPQDEVAEQQAENIVQAMRYCLETAERPVESRFAWTVETGWTLARFWERADDSQKALFARLAREGRIEITASYLHLTQLVPSELLLRSLAPVLAIAEECGVHIDSAMVSDVTGVNWFYAQLLPQIGVRYLNMAINLARGVAPLADQRPGGFWWESPGGDRLLVWNNEHYMHGTRMLNFPLERSFAVLQAYLRGLRERGYPYDTVLLPIQGYQRDNAMPNPAVGDMVEDFNRQAGEPLCRLVTVGQALRAVEARYGQTLPVYVGAWPDWWDDGVGSSAFETGLVRFAHGRIAAAEIAATLAHQLGASWPFRHGELERTRENLLLYDEHTWGWWRSVEDPYSLQTRALGHHKIAYAENGSLQADRYAERAARVLAQQVVSPSDDEGVILFNPLAWPRRELVSWNVRWRNPADNPAPAVRVIGPDGAETPCRNHLLNYLGHINPFSDLWVDFEAQVPALGYAIYRFQPTACVIEAPALVEGTVAESVHYRVEVDEDGRVRSLIDKSLDRELIGSGPWTLHQLIYETITSPGGRSDLVHSYHPFEFAAGAATVERRSPPKTRTQVRSDLFGVSLVSISSMPNFPSIVQEIRLDHFHKWVDFTTRFVKSEVEAAEAAYIAFPFAIKPHTVRCHIAGGAFDPIRGQLPGSATDWYDIQNGVELIGDDLAIVWLCGEAPLLEFGEMKTGLAPSPPNLDNGTLFSYVLNNHWFTNFFARQGGEFTFRYRLLSSTPEQRGNAGRASREFLNPFIAARIGVDSPRGPGIEILRHPSAPGADLDWFAEIVEGSASLDTLKPADNGDGIVLRLYETAGVECAARVRLNWSGDWEAELCDIRERVLERITRRNDEFVTGLRPYGTATVRIRGLGPTR